MYFWTDGPHKTWLDNCIKSPFSEDPSTSNMLNGWNNVGIWTAAPLAHWLISLKELQLEKVSLSDRQNLRTVNTLTSDDKYSLLKRDNLLQHFQVQFSQKQKTFFQFFLAFLKFTLNFQHLPKVDDPHIWCILEHSDSEKRG